MKYALLAALISGALCCAQDTETSKQSLHGVISNLDSEPAPYNPSNSLRYAATPTPSLRAERRDSAPGQTLGAITDFQETYGLPVFGQGNQFLNDDGVYFPGYFGNGAYGRQGVGRITARTGARGGAQGVRAQARARGGAGGGARAAGRRP